MEKRIDAKGMTCPKPVILAKKEMEASKKGETILVEVDNEMAAENLRKLANSQEAGYEVSKKSEKLYEVKITVSREGNSFSREKKEEKEEEKKERGKLVVVFSSDKMGEGEEELGQILVKGFIYALTQMERLPDILLFYNKGAYLTSEDSPVLEDLKALEEAGCELYTCGTCMDYYGLKEKLKVGAGANMYFIADTMRKAEKIIKP